jgi:hypothetical protein
MNSSVAPLRDVSDSTSSSHAASIHNMSQRHVSTNPSISGCNKSSAAGSEVEAPATVKRYLKVSFNICLRIFFFVSTPSSVNFETIYRCIVYFFLHCFYNSQKSNPTHHVFSEQLVNAVFDYQHTQTLPDRDKLQAIFAEKYGFGYEKSSRCLCIDAPLMGFRGTFRLSNSSRRFVWLMNG